ncbi:MAG TPA: phage tail protein [Solirubrobacteraceae bacterium]|nr:phage tail protein [Solirubrobacteraceae bacterium]
MPTIFPINQHRLDPYKNFRFRLKWDGQFVAAVSKMSALKRTTEVVRHRDGGSPMSVNKSPGRTDFEAITLERGLTLDRAFDAWARKVWRPGAKPVGGAELSLKDFRKEVEIEIYNEAGQLVLAYNVFRCWVSEYQALPELDANANAIAIETLKLENEGWALKPVPELAEPALT